MAVNKTMQRSVAQATRMVRILSELAVVGSRMKVGSCCNRWHSPQPPQKNGPEVPFYTLLHFAFSFSIPVIVDTLIHVVLNLNVYMVSLQILISVPNPIDYWPSLWYCCLCVSLIFKLCLLSWHIPPFLFCLPSLILCLYLYFLLNNILHCIILLTDTLWCRKPEDEFLVRSCHLFILWDLIFPVLFLYFGCSPKELCKSWNKWYTCRSTYFYFLDIL